MLVSLPAARRRNTSQQLMLTPHSLVFFPNSLALLTPSDLSVQSQGELEILDNKTRKIHFLHFNQKTDTVTVLLKMI